MQYYSFFFSLSLSLLSLFLSLFLSLTTQDFLHKQNDSNVHGGDGGDGDGGDGGDSGDGGDGGGGENARASHFKLNPQPAVPHEGKVILFFKC